LEVGIVGLPQSGKTTIFNAATRGKAQGTARPDRPTLGVAKVLDPRLQVLAGIEDSKKITPAEVTFLDLPAPPEGFGKSAGIGGEMLAHLQRVDALAVVVRAFEDPSVIHVLDRIDHLSDAESLLTELAFVDMAVIERRLSRLKESLRGAKTAERQVIEKESALLQRLLSGLEDEIGVADQQMSEDERKVVTGFGLLTTKPVVLVANLGESQIPQAGDIETALAEKFASGRVKTTAVFGMLEVDLASMDGEDEAEFRADMGLGESGLVKMVRASYDALGLITFFTVGPKETHAWPIRAGTNAKGGAGTIHSDLERGFIRSEIVGYDDYVEARSEAEAKRRGTLRQEGKSYVLKDGDIVHVLFNV
jgi:ribosome-binding ATPase